MDKQDLNKEKLLEQVVSLLEEGRELSDEEWAWLRQDEETRKACIELLVYKEALLRQNDSSAPNPATEWERMRKRLRPAQATPAPRKSTRRGSRRFLLGVAAGVAASFLLVFFYAWATGRWSSKEELMVFQATDSIQQILLQTSTGSRVALAAETEQAALDSIGVALHTKDTLCLAYAPTSPAQAPEVHRLSTPRGKDFKLTLADGTIVWMNAESSLEYPATFTGAFRSVRLQGEAYFKVAHDAAHPFIIHTDRMQIEVLGTELNVRHYRASASHVTLIEGSVEVCDARCSTPPIRLTPGEDAQWQPDGTFAVKNVDTDAHRYWREGYFYFDDQPLTDVMQELGRWYNLNVLFENKQLTDLRIRYFCIRSETPERAISLLNGMKKIRATLNGNTVYIR